MLFGAFSKVLPRTQTSGALIPNETLGRIDVLTTANFVLDSFTKGAQSHLLESGGKVRESESLDILGSFLEAYKTFISYPLSLLEREVPLSSNPMQSNIPLYYSTARFFGNTITLVSYQWNFLRAYLLHILLVDK